MKKKVKVASVKTALLALTYQDERLTAGCDNAADFLKKFATVREAWEKVAKGNTTGAWFGSWVAWAIQRLRLTGFLSGFEDVSLCPCRSCCPTEKERERHLELMQWKTVRGPILNYCRKYGRRLT
jgi:hypothetical protein